MKLPILLDFNCFIFISVGTESLPFPHLRRFLVIWISSSGSNTLLFPLASAFEFWAQHTCCKLTWEEEGSRFQIPSTIFCRANSWMEEDPLIASTIKAEPPTIIILSVVRDERSCVPFHVVSASVRLLVDSHRPHAKSRQTSPLGSNIVSLH